MPKHFQPYYYTAHRKPLHGTVSSQLLPSNYKGRHLMREFWIIKKLYFMQQKHASVLNAHMENPLKKCHARDYMD